MEYRQFWIRIRNRQQVEVSRPPGVPMNSAPVPMDRLRERTIKVLSRYLATGAVKTREELIVLGSHLFAGLIEEPVRDALAKELDTVKRNKNMVLRLVLEFTEAAREL